MYRRRWLLSLCALPLLACSSRSRLDPLEAQAGPEQIEPIAVEAWGGLASPMPAQPQAISWITVHHQGELWEPTADVAAYLRRLQTWSRRSKGWVDIPYHFIVAPDGQVYAGRPWALPGDTNTDYDPRGHLLVMLLGNFEIQHPTARQWDATVRLLATLQRRFALQAERIGSHRDHAHHTVCPGAHLSARFPELKSAVADLLASGRDLRLAEASR